MGAGNGWPSYERRMPASPACWNASTWPISIPHIGRSASAAPAVPAHAVYPSGELTSTQHRYPAPRGHRRQIDIFRNDQEGADLRGQVQDEIVLMVAAVVDGAGRTQNPAPGSIRHLDQDVSVVL